MSSAKVSTSENDQKDYIGSTKGTFKSIYTKHKGSFPNPVKANPKIKLWDLSSNNIKYSIE